MRKTPNPALENSTPSPVREPEPAVPVTDPEPNPAPKPDTPDPEPDRNPNPGPPTGPDPDPGEEPRTDPPAQPDVQPIKASAAGDPPEGSLAPQVQLPPPEVAQVQSPAPEVPEAPPLVLTSRPVPPEKPLPKAAAKPKKAEEEQFSPFDIMVGQVYDGPLDLLLDLIRKQDIDIYDIPIARITAQFLAYVNQLKASDVDVAGEFIYTASLLIHIKSKMLLPRMPVGPDDVPEDPRRELVERLLEHERFKNAAQMLQQKQMLEAATWTNPGVREFKEDAAAEPEVAADTTDLVRIFREIMERARRRPTFNVQDDAVTVGQMIQFLGRRLMMEDKPVALRKLLSHSKSERALVAMFLALLELVRLQAVLLRQDRAFSEIFIKKNTEFDAVMTEGMAARDDWR
jgi:segregation and condensation protein A